MSVGRSVGRSVRRSVGRSVRRSVTLSWKVEKCNIHSAKNMAKFIWYVWLALPHLYDRICPSLGLSVKISDSLFIYISFQPKDASLASGPCFTLFIFSWWSFTFWGCLSALAIKWQSCLVFFWDVFADLSKLIDHELSKAINKLNWPKPHFHFLRWNPISKSHRF